EAGDRVRDDAPSCELDVVAALEEALIGAGIGDEAGASSGEARSEGRSLETRQPERTGRHERVGTAKHLELQVRDDVGERHDGPRDEVARAEAAGLFAAEEGDD